MPFLRSSGNRSRIESSAVQVRMPAQYVFLKTDGENPELYIHPSKSTLKSTNEFDIVEINVLNLCASARVADRISRLFKVPIVFVFIRQSTRLPDEVNRLTRMEVNWSVVGRV